LFVVANSVAAARIYREDLPRVAAARIYREDLPRVIVSRNRLGLSLSKYIRHRLIAK
jgi:hypothetical protein